MYFSINFIDVLHFLDIQSPSVVNIDTSWTMDTSSFSLQWNGVPPKLTGSPRRNITQYAVTISRRDGEAPKVVYIPAEAGTVYAVTGLQKLSTYDIEVDVVIDTEGQGKQTYDLGISLITVNTPAPSK